MTTSTQKIPSGYKQTEIGVIPTDWDVKRLGEVADYKNGKSFESRITDIGDYFLITLNSLDIKGKLKSDHLRVNTSDKSLSKDDLVMILSDVAHGNFLGLTDVIPENDKYVLNQRIGALKNIRHLTPYYLSKYINFKQRYFKTAGQGSSQQNLAKDDILNFSIAYPNSKTEQSAIATTLSNVEALIEKLERLIEKKNNIKQGAMQELLTGKRRLAGFSGKWKVKKLGEVANVVGGGTPTTSVVDYWNGDIDWFTPTEIGIDKYVYESRRKITIEGLKNSSAKILDEGTILLTSRAGIGDLAILKVKACTNQGFQSLVPINNTDSEFLYYLMITKKDALLEKASGSTFLEISPNNVRAIELTVPEPTEQTAIANVLSDMDIEIEKLESQLTKYQNIKQGMMQTLLTGKIRLLTK